MSGTKSWILTDTQRGIHRELWSVTHEDLGAAGEPPWSIEKRTLRGGLSDGVEVIEVDNGRLRFTVLPTRGMGIWRGSCGDAELGWRAPVRGPVHPKFVNELAYGGIGWIAGFDEWIVRCGLNSNGAPGVDEMLDNRGNPQQMPLTLHGHIANLPASHVEIRIDSVPPHTIELVGRVEESKLFFPQLELTSRVRTTPGEARLVIHDTIRNLRGQPAELELLYHCNFGPPILEEGARLVAPLAMVAPANEVARDHIDHFDTIPGPTPGVIEQVFWMKLLGEGPDERTLAVLRNRAGDLACALRFSLKQLPWFTIWRNPGAISDGYVTGLEPATNLPNTKRFEREQGRVVSLPPGGSYDAELSVEVAEGAGAVAALADEVARLQATGRPMIHAAPTLPYSPS